MRDLIITENITLDGVIDASAGWFSPAGGETDMSDVVEALAEQRAGADAFLVGRRTFEQMRGYWPQRTDDETGVSEYLNRVPKYVVSRTLEDAGWEPTTVLRGPLDEYRLFVYPTVVGAGQRLFEAGTEIPALDLVESRAFRSGIVLARYRPHAAD